MGGGGGDGGAGEARQQEADRQARIKAATDAINATFNNQVKKSRQAFFDAGGNEISRERYDELLKAAATPRMDGTTEGFIMGMMPDAAFMPTTRNIEYWEDGDPANSRENLYREQRGAVFDLNRMEVDRQATDAERVNRFGLARSGLMGGSAQIDSVADINRRTNEGLMRAGGIADQASADLRTADEQARANLISLAQSGIDTGTAASQALNSLKVNNANATSARAGATVGGLFNDLSQAYLMNQANAGRMAGMAGQGNQQWYGVSNPRTGNAGTVTR